MVLTPSRIDGIPVVSAGAAPASAARFQLPSRASSDLRPPGASSDLARLSEAGFQRPLARARIWPGQAAQIMRAGAPAAGRRAPLRHRHGQSSHKHQRGCSRRWSAGSIAATGSCWPTRRTPGRVLPPLVGGLHCGKKTGSTAALAAKGVLPPLVGGLHCGSPSSGRSCTARRGAPAAGRRAPLRRTTHKPCAGRGDRVLPPLVGGLHCGALFVVVEGKCRNGAPAAGRRAPLRLQLEDVSERERVECSRRWSAGSIAAHSTAVLPLAPDPVLPPLVGGLHCGPPDQWRPVSSCSASVLPPLVGGLHCGTVLPCIRSIEACRCSRRWSAGSIAAAMVSPAPVPASHVLPPLVGGLHCGCTTTARRSAGRRVLPPLVGGLHCGTRSVPAMVTDGSECSRRWSAGSIAAATGQAPS